MFFFFIKSPIVDDSFKVLKSKRKEADNWHLLLTNGIPDSGSGTLPPATTARSSITHTPHGPPNDKRDGRNRGGEWHIWPTIRTAIGHWAITNRENYQRNYCLYSWYVFYLAKTTKRLEAEPLIKMDCGKGCWPWAL